MNGIAPNTAIMNAICSANSVQPSAHRRSDEQRRLQQHDAEVEPLQRIAVDQQADGDLRERRDDVDAREQRAEHRRDRAVMPAKRSRSNWPLPLVVKLNSRLDEIAATVMTRKIRASVGRVVRGARVARPCAGGASSLRRDAREGDAARDAPAAPERRTPRASRHT